VLSLYLEAPFAAFRTFTAGSFRPTAEFITPSAAYGLLLNVAGIDMREDDGRLPMTLIRSGLPKFRLALGALAFPLLHSLYQQLHNYRVGDEKIDDPLEPGKKVKRSEEGLRRCRGNKFNVVPIRRAFLSDLKAYICVDGSPETEEQIREGLHGRRPRAYGLPFLGDNNFLIDRLEPVDRLQQEAFWFRPVPPGGADGLREHVTRLTVRIDRTDMARTTSALFAPVQQPSVDIPDDAWVEVGY
jgi:CRISPR-associated protein Cas5t